MAENCNQYLSKGRRVLVEGTLTPDPQTGGPRLWNRQDGSIGASYEIRATDVRFLGGGNGNGSSNYNDSVPAQTPEEDQIPF